MLVLQVFIFRDGQFLGNEMCTGDRLEIGRDPSCDLVLQDDNVSRRHAMLFEHDGRLAVQDAGSHIGTEVNGARVTTPRYVGPRDDVKIGRYTLKFKMMSGMPGEAPAANPMGVLPPTAHVDVDELRRMAAAAGHLQTSHPPAGAEPSGPHPVSLPPVPGAVESHDPDATQVDLLGSIGQDLDAALMGAFPDASQPTAVVDGPPAAMRRPVEAPLSDEDIGPSLGSFEPAGAGLAASGLFGEPTAVDHGKVPFSAGAAGVAPFTPGSAAMADTLVRQPTGAGVIPPPPLSDPNVTLPEVVTDSTRKKSQEDLPLLGDIDDAAIPAVEWKPGAADEDEDDDEDPIPHWSIVQALVAATDGTPPAKDLANVVEVIHYRRDRVLDHAELAEGERFDFGRIYNKQGLRDAGLGKTVGLVKHKKGGVAELVLSPEVNGRLLREGQQVDIKSLPEAQGKKGRLPLTQGDLASLELLGDRVFVRIGKVPKVAPTEEMKALEKRQRKVTLTAFGIAAGTWAMMIAIAWIAQYRALSESVIQLEDEGFAEVIEPELELEEPEPEPEEPKIEEEVPEPEKPKEAPKPDPTPPKTEVKDAPKTPGVLDALKNVPKAKAGNESLTAALSNVKGVRVPGASGFKVSSMVGKGPSGVQIGGASGGVDTNSLNSILRKGGGTGNLANKQSRNVKGTVQTLKRMSQVKGQGQLSKEEIQKVINANVGKIQYCYEKQLRMQPGLSGKVVLEWTIGTDGRVKVVKSNQSSLKSPGAINCMISSLKTWKFPKPRGNGTVIVKYPFIFNTL